MFDLEDNEIFQEAKLTTKERDKLPSSEFGIPEERAFPLNDEEHIRAAVSMFPHAAKQYKPGLAQRILAKAKKLGIDTRGWDSLKEYVNECDAVQEGFFVAGFGNLRTRIADYLGDKFTVSHVKKPMAASEMFDIKNNENTDTVVKVEGTGTGVKITAKTGFEVERFGNNVPLSNAFKKLISVIDSLFPGQVVTESNVEDRSPTGSGLDKNFNRGLFYMNMKTGELIAPNGSAHGTVKRGNDYWVPIDEMMAPVAYICNKKGYTTSDCCQGHPACSRMIEDNIIKNVPEAGSTPYIGIIGKHNFKNLPHGWYQGQYGTPENPRTSINLYQIDSPSGTNIDTRKYTEYYNKITKAISDLCKYFEKLPPLGQNNETPIKEAYVMGDRSIDNFRYLMESANEKEDIDTDDEDLNEDNIDQLNDGDDDGVEVSVSTTKFTMPTDSDQQNDYDPRDVERLNKLIAAESDAINDYFDATKDSNDETLRRLYGDIGHEERFHLEQLLYAKSTLTGEKYEPRDPEVKKEYEELLAMGMDEDTAMSTAFDKRSMAQEDDDSDDLEDEQEDAEVLEFAVSNFVASEELLETLHTVRTPSLQKSIDTFMEAYLIQEGIDNVAAKAPSTATTNNVARNNNGPIRMIFNGLKAIIRFVKKLAQNVKITCKKLLTRQKRIHQFIKQNGISGIFANGVSLYFYNDKNCTYMDAALQYVDMCDRLTGIIANNVNMRNEWQHTAVLPSNVNPITFGNFDNGISILKGVVLTKTKVVVTQDNKGKLAELFFGYTEQPANPQTGQSGNIMFKIQKITDVTANYLDRVEKFMGKLQTAHDDPANGGRMNQFNEAIKSMGIIKNSIQKFVKALTYDNNEIIKLDNGILNDTKTKDAAREQQPAQQQP